MRHRIVTVISILLVVALTGCSGGLQPVRGKVMLPDGKPAANSQVVFDGPVGGKPISARGDVQADGSFQLSTSQPGDGVPVGKYRVQVNPPPLVDAEARSAAPFNAKFSDFSSSGLEFEVKAGSNDFFDSLNEMSSALRKIEQP